MADLKVSGKTGLTAAAGALGVLVVWGLTLAGVEVPAEVAAAISTLLAAVIAWLVPAKSGSYVVTDPPLDEADRLENRVNVDPDEFEDGA